jgi:hypothetical protein
MKHTPGPWKFDYRPDGHAKRFDAEILDSDGYNIGTLGAHPDLLTKIRTPEEMEANAKLISSAPEMLEALKYCKTVFEAQLDTDEPYYKQVVAALSKAQ